MPVGNFHNADLAHTDRARARRPDQRTLLPRRHPNLRLHRCFHHRLRDHKHRSTLQ